MNIDLTNKNFIVTGGSKGIGTEIVKLIVDYGGNVVFTYNNSKAEVLNLKKWAKGKNGKVYPFKMDISDCMQIEPFSEFVDSKFDYIDGLINNAGICKDKPFSFMTLNDWNDVINVNVNGTFNITKAIIDKMLLNESGKIVNISSIAGLFGNIGQANYSASKAAIIAFTKTLAKEYAAYNIQVNAVAPGLIETKMIEKIPNKERLIKKIPLQRAGTPLEVAYLTVFLLSSLSSYITGQVIIIDGGLSC